MCTRTRISAALLAACPLTTVRLRREQLNGVAVDPDPPGRQRLGGGTSLDRAVGGGVLGVVTVAADDVVPHGGEDAALMRALRAEGTELAEARLGDDDIAVGVDDAAADRDVVDVAQRLCGRLGWRGDWWGLVGAAGGQQRRRRDAGGAGENGSSGRRVGHQGSSTSLALDVRNHRVMRIKGGLKQRQCPFGRGTRTTELCDPSTQDSQGRGGLVVPNSHASNNGFKDIPESFSASAINWSVVALPARCCAAQSRRMAKNGVSPTFTRNACSTIAPRS